MKSLTQHIQEKLIINKDYKSADTIDISQLKKLDWEDKDYYIMTMERTAIDQVKDWVIDNSTIPITHKSNFEKIAEKNCIMAYNNSRKILIVFRRAPHTSPNGYPRYDKCEVLTYPNKETRMKYRDNICAINIPIFDPHSSLEKTAFEYYVLDWEILDTLKEYYNFYKEEEV